MGDLVHKPGTPPTIGLWDDALHDPNIEDAPASSSEDERAAGPSSMRSKIAHALEQLGTMPLLARAEAAYRAKFRLKSWQYMTATSPDLFIAFVVGTAGYASNGFVYCAELAGDDRGTTHEKFSFTPFSVGTTVAPTSARGSHKFATRGLTVAIDNLDAGRRFAVRIDARTVKNAPLSAELDFTSPDDQHMALCHPMPNGRWNYTHKLAGFRVAGNVSVAGKQFAFTPATSFGSLDFTKQYAQRHSIWKWVSVAGLTQHDKRFGLNFVDPTPEAPVTENAIWIGGVREPLEGVTLTTSGDAWSLVSDTVDITATRVAQVEQHLDTPLVKHTLKHIVSSFSGRVRTRSGHVHDLENVVGICEDFDNLW